MHYLSKYFKNIPNWTKWEERNNIEGIERVGAYIIALSSEDIPPDKDLSIKSVVYIGETHSKTTSLRNRMNYFSRAAKGKKASHSGGETFNEIYGPSELTKSWVIAFPAPPEFSKEQGGVFAQLIERELIWLYYLKHSKLPTCNKK